MTGVLKVIIAAVMSKIISVISTNQQTSAGRFLGKMSKVLNRTCRIFLKEIVVICTLPCRTACTPENRSARQTFFPSGNKIG